MRWLTEPYLPKSRPALLAIEAKEQDVLCDGTKKHKRRGDEKRYIPLVKQESSREKAGIGARLFRGVLYGHLREGGAVGWMMILGGEETGMTGGEETSRKDSDRDLDQYRDVDTRVRVQDYNDHAEMGIANGGDRTGQTNFGTDLAATRNSTSRACLVSPGRSKEHSLHHVVGIGVHRYHLNGTDVI